MNTKVKSLSIKHGLIAATLCIIICLNIHSTYQTLKTIEEKKEFIPMLFRGSYFKAFQADLNNIPFVGYVTDQNINHPKANEQFSQAQYMLAPTILDSSSTDYEYILIAHRISNISPETLIKLNVLPVRVLNDKTMLTRKRQ